MLFCIMTTRMQKISMYPPKLTKNIFPSFQTIISTITKKRKLEMKNSTYICVY